MNILSVNIKQASYLDEDSVIRNINFTVPKGEIIGLIGQNGAGKSTTIKAILGQLKNMKGDIEIGGRDGIFAYVPEHPVFYEDLTLWEHLELVQIIFALDRNDFISKANNLLDTFRLQEKKHILPNSFSKGMQQKLMLILAFLINPDIYIVDEPFIGLDPRSIKNFLLMLEEEKHKGKGILLSTHVLDTAERICDSFVILENGNLIAKGTKEEIIKNYDLQCSTLFDCLYEILERS